MVEEETEVLLGDVDLTEEGQVLALEVEEEASAATEALLVEVTVEASEVATVDVEVVEVVQDVNREG